jgi:hypothetical protein
LINDKNLKVNPSKFLLLLENFLFQYFAIGNNPGNSVERLFSNISNELYETTKKEPKHVVKEQDRCFQINTKRIIDIYSEYVNKDAFYESFLGLKYSSRGKPYKINRYILEKYEYFLWVIKGKVSNELEIKYQES